MKLGDYLSSLAKVVSVKFCDEDGVLFCSKSDSKEFELHKDTEIVSHEPYMRDNRIDDLGVRIVIASSSSDGGDDTPTIPDTEGTDDTTDTEENVTP